jgi:CheY-like chemotaxis protein
VTESKTRVLDVGQCGPDHMMIRRTLTDHFDVQVDRAADVPEALQAMRNQPYALVLVNRLIDGDRSEGMALVTEARNDPSLRETPIMLVSDIEDAQRLAVAAGAVPGFGKSKVGDSSTVRLLAQYLPPR